MPLYSKADWKNAQPDWKEYGGMTLMDLDIIKHQGYHIPMNTDLDNLEAFLATQAITTKLAWHLRDKKAQHYSLQPYYNKTFYILAHNRISHVVKISKKLTQVFETIKGKRYPKYNKDQPIWQSDQVTRYWWGMNTHPFFYRNSWSGNSVLMKLGEDDNKYIEFTDGAQYTYTLNPDEKILGYYSIIYSDCVISNAEHDYTLKYFYAISYGVTTMGRIFRQGKFIKDPFPQVPKTPFFSLFYFEHFLQKIKKKRAHGNHRNGKGMKSLAKFGKPHFVDFGGDPMDITMWNILKIQNFDFYVPPGTNRQHLAEQFKLMSLDYLYRINWDYQYTTLEELQEKQWRPRDVTREPDRFQIMRNCFSNFEFREEAGVIKIYNQSYYKDKPDKYGIDIQVFHGEPCYVIEDYVGYWMGENTSGCHYVGAEHGNTIIVKLNATEYLEVSIGLTKFTLPNPEDEILVYYSSIGNNGVPYPWTLTKLGNLIDPDSGNYVSGSKYALPKTPLFADMIISQFYNNIKNIGSPAFESQKIETEVIVQGI